jgi:hypothetical protein
MLSLEMKDLIWTMLASLAATLVIFGATARSERGPNRFDKRANVTDTEVLEDIAQARTCEDCQVCYYELAFDLNNSQVSMTDQRPLECDARSPRSRR